MRDGRDLSPSASGRGKRPCDEAGKRNPVTRLASPRGDTMRPNDSLWRNRNFVLLWFGQGAGMLGPQVALIAMPLLALEVLHATTFEVALLTFLGWLPYLVFSLPAGVVADRFDQRRVMIICDLARMSLMLSIPVVTLAGRLSLGYLYAVISLSGVLTVLFTVAYRGQLPKLVSGERLVDGNGKLGVSERLAELSGPAIGGALAGMVGAARALYTNVLALLLSAITLWLIKVPTSDSTGRPARVTFKTAMGEGLTFVRREPILRRLLWCTSVCNFFVMASVSIQITFMDRDLGASETAIGLVFTAGAVGGVLAGVFAHRIAVRVGTARIIWMSMLLPGPLYFLMPLARPGWGLAMYGVGLAAMSANSTLFNTAALSYRQLVCPPELLSRVSAVYLWIAYGVVPLGSLFGGLLATQVGMRFTLLVCVLGMWSAALFVVFPPLRGMRDVPVPEAS